MLKVLFIDDQEESIQSAKNLIEREEENVQCDVSAFDGAKDKIASLRPDIVILDLLVGGTSPDPDPEGLRTRKFIWDKHFCPIVVYSAYTDIHDDEYEPHPFVKSIKKGARSPQKVLNALKEFRPQVEALEEAGEHIRYSFSCAMRDVAPHAFKALSDTTQRIDTIKRSGRRRLAALMDEIPEDGTTLASWEQYLYPPVCPDTQLGDVLKTSDGESSDPTSFRVVLTPSCDLVASGGRTPKVSKVLVARCCSIRKGLDLTNLKDLEVPKLRKRLISTLLTPGYLGAVIPFPHLEGKIPTMVANLRDLDLIAVDKIDLSDKPFIRVASVDSPFRELVAWAYMQNACRPSLPDRDFDSWRDEIIRKMDTVAGEDEGL